MIKPKDPMTVISAGTFAFLSALVVFSRALSPVWYLVSVAAAVAAMALTAYQYLTSKELRRHSRRQQLHAVLTWVSLHIDGMSMLALTLVSVGFTGYVLVIRGLADQADYRLLLVAVAVDFVTCAALAIQPYTRKELSISWQLMLIRREVFHVVWTTTSLGIFHLLVLWFWLKPPVSETWFVAVFLICGFTAILQVARVLVLRKASRIEVIEMPDMPPA